MDPDPYLGSKIDGSAPRRDAISILGSESRSDFLAILVPIFITINETQVTP